MVWISEAPVRPLAWDTAAADRLLDSLGWRRGEDGIRRQGGRRMAFTMLTPTTSRIREEVAVHLQSQLRRAGIAMQIQPVDLSVFDQRTRTGNFDAMMFSRTLDPSPTILGQFWTRTAIGGDNFGRYDSPGFDSLYARATAANGKAAALPLWSAVLQRLIDDAPGIAIFSPRNNAAIHRRLEHVTIRPDSWLATVASWSVAPDRRLPRDR
jgi:peptide/nickel transport system substrate-binding protein